MAHNGSQRQVEQSNRRGQTAKTIGNVIGVRGKGKDLKEHYASFELEGRTYHLDDEVLVMPSEHGKPYVAIIKEIVEDIYGNVIVTAQWFYRPEEAVREGGGTYDTPETDAKVLFYSFHFNEIPAEAILHKCTVHFVPSNKHFDLDAHRGFIVQKVYDKTLHKLRELKDKDYEEYEKLEIDGLVKRTQERVGELPDRNVVKKISTSSVDASKVEPTSRLNRLKDAYGRKTKDFSKYHQILSEFKVLTGTANRDLWLEKLLQVTQKVCKSDEGTSTGSREGDIDGKIGVNWPNAVVPIISALEMNTYEATGSFDKYNQKMRQLAFNLKNNSNLARRLLSKEIEPITLLTMSPDELKKGFTSDESKTEEAEETEPMQILDAQCSKCMMKQIGVMDLIYAGGFKDRYELKCIHCGNNWYASRDDIARLTI